MENKASKILNDLKKVIVEQEEEIENLKDQLEDERIDRTDAEDERDAVQESFDELSIEKDEEIAALKREIVRKEKYIKQLQKSNGLFLNKGKLPNREIEKLAEESYKTLAFFEQAWDKMWVKMYDLNDKIESLQNA